MVRAITRSDFTVFPVWCGACAVDAVGPPATPRSSMDADSQQPAAGGDVSSRDALLRTLDVYVGTYTDRTSHGIYRFTLDPASGATTEPVLAAASENPSFLAMHPNRRVLYAVNEVASFRGERSGAVSAFAIDPASHALSPINQQPSGGADPCHLIVDREGRHVLVANYNGGNVAVLPLDASGCLQPATSVRQHAGSGPHPRRQTGPHAHAVLLDAAERFAFATDLGAERVFVYRFDAKAGSLVPNTPEAVALDPGAGPRHLAWHPSGAYLYALNELRSTVTVFRYSPDAGALQPLQTISVLPQGFSGENLTAEIAVTSNGRFLYASNRGHDSIAILAIDAAGRALTSAGFVSTGGRIPRHFAIDPSGRWLLAANQESDSITIFRVDAATGRLTPSGTSLTISKPVCVLFVPRR
jgi:6-phosphogluconolactonase